MRKLFFIVLALVAISTVALYAQQSKPMAHEHHGMAEKGGHCNMMSANKEMADKMAANDAKLQSLVATMNSARGDAKVDAMSAVINELVTQRAQMRNDMMSMHGSMSGCCMMSGDKSAAKGMESCPMHKKNT